MRQGGVAATLIIASSLLMGCSSTDILGTNRLSNIFGSSASNNSTPATAGSTTAVDYDCPTVEIRSGAAALSVAPQGEETSANNLRYQANFGQTARECALRGGNLTIKVGIQGRVVLGPAGAPGPVTVPLRVAIVREGIEPKLMLSKFQQITVNVEPGQTSAAYTTVIDDLTFPMPSGAELDACVIYVGFDPEGAPKPTPKKSSPKTPPDKKPARGAT
jgi:hypothetical protein